jgi:hypothetical protein
VSAATGADGAGAAPALPICRMKLPSCVKTSTWPSRPPAAAIQTLPFGAIAMPAGIAGHS